MENHLRIAKGFDILTNSFAPYIAREFINTYKDNWWQKAILDQLYEDQKRSLPKEGTFAELVDSLDIALCLLLADLQWNDIFRKKLSKECRTWLNELRTTRNNWAHRGSQDISDNDTWRALDTMSRFCEQIDPDGATEINAILREARYGSEEGSVSVTHNTSADRIQKNPAATTVSVDDLPSWRDVIEPHQDVAEGRYRNAEFAADLAQVARGEGSLEYRDPVEFFGRTYVTEGMKGLLVQSLRRVAGLDGEPIVQLKTAFGGGKTHSMLALYHLMRSNSKRIKQIPNIEPIFDAAGINIEEMPEVHVAVIVGTALNPAKGKRPPDMPGITVNTIWGEIAYQLAISKGDSSIYDYVREADRRGVSPGSLALKDMFDACGCAVILIDELVAYAKKLYGAEKLPAGSSDNFITFIQELTEAARASEKSLVVASIPESEREIGGDSGQLALEAIEHTFGRMEAIWKPVSASEGFEVVRRRLFLDCKNTAKRDAVCNAFSKMYNDKKADFPVEACELEYRDRMISCYPIHPEVFDRLYEDWATLETFQRTRGVLRLMAAVINELWTKKDTSPMIMPGSFPLDSPNVRDELTRYLNENWNGVVDSEIDGENSLPYKKDQTKSKSGQLLASRRVSRTIMLGSAPDVSGQTTRGIEKSRIRLGVVQPEEPIAVFNDALSSLQNSSSFLYSDKQGNRFWYDTRPTLRKTMEDRAQQIDRADAVSKVVECLKTFRKCSPLEGLHICPAQSLDVVDEQKLRCVILHPADIHRRGTLNSPAITRAADILANRGTTPRKYKNMLVFVACDANAAGLLEQAARSYLAWKSILNDKESLNLDMVQTRETEQNVRRAEETLRVRLQEAYSWLITPDIDFSSGAMNIMWTADSIEGSNEDIAQKAVSKLASNGKVIDKWAPALLKSELDSFLWKDKNHLQVKTIWEYMCTYCYLSRLANSSVLEETIMEGALSKDFFGVAAGIEERDNQEGIYEERYIDLTVGKPRTSIHMSDYLVKLTVAEKQIDTEDDDQNAGGNGNDPGGNGGGNNGGYDPSKKVSPQLPKTFSMSAKLDNLRANHDVKCIIDEVVDHLMRLDGANVELSFEVHACVDDGISDQTKRTITENCDALHIEDYYFRE